MSGEVLQVDLDSDYSIHNLKLYLADIVESQRIVISQRDEDGEFTVIESPAPLIEGETYYVVVTQDPEYFLRFVDDELLLFEEDRFVLVKNKNSGLFSKNSHLAEHGILRVQLCDNGWEFLQTILKKNNLGDMNKEAAARAFCLFFLDRSYHIKLY